MNNDLIVHQNGLPGNPTPAPNVTQHGSDAVYIENNGGGTVNINQFVSMGPTTGEDLMAVQGFSKDYYQLIVTCEDIMEVNALTMPASRSLLASSVPPEIFERCSALSPEGQEALKLIPAIICHENTGYNGVTDEKQLALYARITKIKPAGKEIKIYFRPLDAIPQRHLIQNYIDFGLNMSCAITDLNITAWSVRKLNLFEAFADTGLTNLRMPV